MFFISSDKTDKKKTLPELEVQNTLPNEEKPLSQGMAFDQGASRPQDTITAKSTGAPQNTENIVEYRRKKLVSGLLFNSIIFLFNAKSGGRGRKKVVGPRPYQPLPLRGPCQERLITTPGTTCP